MLKVPDKEKVKNLRAYNFIDGEGKLLSLDHFFTIYNILIDNLIYSKIISSIPRIWKERLKSQMNSLNPLTIYSGTTIKTRGVLRDITKVTNRSLYWVAVEKL